MATREKSLFGLFAPDTSGLVYPSTMAAEMSLTNSKATPCYVIQSPNGADIGGEFSFYLPPDYVGSPVIKAAGILDGTPANTIAFTVSQIMVDEATTNDVAYEAEDTMSNATWTGYADEEEYAISITITPTATYAAGKKVLMKFARDDSVDNTTSLNWLMMRLVFQYVDA